MIANQLGIVGFGSFGQFAARHLTPHFEVTACDLADRSAVARSLGVRWGSIESVVSREVVVLAVPVRSYRQVLASVGSVSRPGRLVIDTASVKEKPIALLEELLPEDCDFVALHPMFGPQSGRAGIRGLKVVCSGARGARAACVQRFLSETLELQVLEMSAARHDREMAYVQGLTHWMARALREIKMPDENLSTPAYRHLLKIEEILREDSDDLFLTIQRENRHTSSARDELSQSLERLARWIDGDRNVDKDDT